jgi:glycosyltransferase involved in cell wall biosynthesis
MIRILELRSVRGTGGGPEKTILAGAAHADSARFAVTVCYIRDVRDAVFSMKERANDHGVEYIEINERHSFDLSVWPALKKLTRQLKADIVHAHDYKTNVLASLLGRYQSVIPLSTVHGWTGHSFRERYVYYPLDKRVLRTFPRLIAVSGEIRHELVRHGAKPERVSVVLNGIDPEKFRHVPDRRASVREAFGYAPEDVVIGSVGRLEPQKRFDLLVSAIARVREIHPAVRLIIAGDGSEKGVLEQQIKDLGLSAECRLIGHYSDVVKFHHALDLFVQSSVYEGTPNVVLEAMAMETPVVATAAGGTAELMRADIDGLVVEPGDLTALYEAMKAALGDRPAAARRAQAARTRVEGELSFSARMAAVERIYEELVATSNSGAVRTLTGAFSSVSPATAPKQSDAGKERRGER